MKDSELRGIILKKFYEVRHHRLVEPAAMPEHFNVHTFGLNPADPEQDFYRICDDLAQKGYLNWKSVRGRGITHGGVGSISAAGIDVVEGNVQPTIAIQIEKVISLSNSNNNQIGDGIFGSGNVVSKNITIGELEDAINKAPDSPQKEEAKGLLKHLISIIPSFIGSVMANTIST